MKTTTRILAFVLATAAGAVFAGEATDPTVKAWQDLMDANGGAMKTLGGMAAGKADFDAAAAGAAKDALVANAKKITEVFKTQASDPKSAAKPEIWANWSDFEAKAKALEDAATALDASSLDSLKAGMDAVGGTCGACHKAYKAG
jgi:cytochrome c556